VEGSGRILNKAALFRAGAAASAAPCCLPCFFVGSSVALRVVLCNSKNGLIRAQNIPFACLECSHHVSLRFYLRIRWHSRMTLGHVHYLQLPPKS
jgi:hypothetical protein